MASNGIVAHRFANRDYKKGLQGSSVHISGRNYYSYSTVFGQWVDLEKKVCVVYLGSTSHSSSKHQLGRYCFPKDVVFFPYDDGGSYYYGWHGCDLLGYSDEFKLSHRWKLMDYWMSEIYAALETIKGGKKKVLDSHARHAIDEYWPYMEKLCSLYKDTTIPKYLKRCDKKYKKLVKALKDGEREVSTLVDLVFGEGTWQAYYDYCGRYRKAEENKAKMLRLCNRLGIANPYEKWCRDSWMVTLSVAEIRKLTAKERNEIHFRTIAAKEHYDKSKERSDKREKNHWNAFRWITGHEPMVDESWYSKCKVDNIRECHNMFTGEDYLIEEECILGFYWVKFRLSFDYDSFRQSEDKEQWIREFYAECKEVQDNRAAVNLLKNVGIVAEKAHRYDDDRFIRINEDMLPSLTEEQVALCKWFIAKSDKHYADEEARRRAEQIRRERMEAERRAEEEFKAKIKQEQIDECLERGEEGCRDLWRKHFMDIHQAERETNYKGDFFMGGNVLLRLSFSKDKVETSKGIRIPISICKKFWDIIKKWHENPSSFKPMVIDTKVSGAYTISSYRDDILTAGCHDIAFAEMERMYNEIIANENAA